MKVIKAKLEKKAVLDGIPGIACLCGWAKSIKNQGHKGFFAFLGGISRANGPGFWAQDPTYSDSILEYDKLSRYDFQGKLAFYEKYKDLEVEFREV